MPAEYYLQYCRCCLNIGQSIRKSLIYLPIILNLDFVNKNDEVNICSQQKLTLKEDLL